MRDINEIIVHCTATRADWWEGKSTERKVNEVRKWHVEGNGWSDIGYHFLIDRDGTVVEGRPVATSGAHTRGHNSNSIGISLFGGHGSTKTDAFSDNFTAEQGVALQNLIDRLKTEYPTIAKVSGHNEYANKACPGFQVGPWLSNRPAPAQRTSITQSRTIQASQLTKIAGIATPVVGALGGLEWPNLLILGILGVIILTATGIIDLERIKKWKAGDR